MSTSNPSHLLISRNPPRSPAHPQLAPTWTSRHAPTSTSGFPSPSILGPWPGDEAGSSRARSSSAPLPHPEDTDDGVDEEEEVENVVIHPTFTREAEMPGRVKVVVGRYEFWCHKEILWFASPFFKALLEGSWAETSHPAPLALETSASPSRRDSVLSTSSPTDTDPFNLPQVSDVAEKTLVAAPKVARALSWQSPLTPDEEEGNNQKASVYLDASEDGPGLGEILRELREIPDAGPSQQIATPLATIEHLPSSENPGSLFGEVSYSPRGHPSTPLPALLQLHSSQPLPPAMTADHPPRSRSARRNRRSVIRHSFSSVPPSSRTPLCNPTTVGQDTFGVEAVVELREESASAFQDFLFWAYPHLECKVTWTNVEDLLALSAKLLVPALQKLCEHFLMTHASGRPVMALSLAEQHGNPDLFREASRFVLDQPTWNQEEMETLSEQTQLKLSQKRTWFLERLLKLGSIDVRKEYTCRADCPDPSRCQVQLDEKWRQAHLAVCRYGPPQPSVTFRCLRQLETFPTNPSLVMSHPLCQVAAKSWVISLFDRMFQTKVVASPFSPGTEKYWLWITMTS